MLKVIQDRPDDASVDGAVNDGSDRCSMSTRERHRPAAAPEWWCYDGENVTAPLSQLVTSLVTR
jgi:hypothetical protein